MDDLRLIGVHEDGEHLLLTGGGGDRFRLRIDDAVRAAVRRDRPRLGQLQIESNGGVRPREIQTMIRSGATVEEVSERTGWPVEKVTRYEGPIVAERAHVAEQAKNVLLRVGSGSGHDTLGSRIDERLKARGVDADAAVWDSSRSEDGHWTVVVAFPAGGRERTAGWYFDTTSRTVVPRDDEARWLAEEEADFGPIPTPHPLGSDRTTSVYDIEAEGGVSEPTPRGSGDEHARGPTPDRTPPPTTDPDDLMSSVRRHSNARGRRRGGRAQSERSGSHGRRTGTSGTRGPGDVPGDEGERVDALPLEPLKAEADSPPPAARGSHSADEEPHAQQDGGQPEVASPEQDGRGRREQRPARGPRGKSRPSVPSWDDVMFGGRPG